MRKDWSGENRVTARKQRRIEAAEHVCRAFRKAISYHATQQQYMDMALDWLMAWIDNSPAAVWQGDPIPRKKRRKKSEKS